MKREQESQLIKSVLLHICCAPCATWVVKELRREGYKSLIGYFYNPNIHPKEEYKRRLSELKQLAAKIELPLIIGPYEIKKWFKQINGLEAESEGGKRCEICYKMRLNKTGKLAKYKGYSAFTTTLTISPYKSTSIINKIGQEVGERYGTEFLLYDFKSKNGFSNSIILSKKYGLYRQLYCGCAFSL
ncbi:MAG: epoxyqueuosine reductase QueH [bacterium]|nr:epoxyqueuosine reductase QueH [bacterium]